MKHIEQSLNFLWLKKEEIQIYLCLLEFWSLAISTISKITKIWRVNCYHYTEKLQNSWYLSISHKSWTKIFIAENPNIFLNKEKERLNVINEIIPNLLLLSSKSQNKPKIQFFEWKEWVKNIFNKLNLIENSEIVSFSNFEKLTFFFENEDFLKKHFLERIKKNIKSRFISPKNNISEWFKEKFFPNDFEEKLLEIFLISQENFYFESEITIFNWSIAIINLSKENPIWILIENESLYKTQKTIFWLAWLWATSFITR